MGGRSECWRTSPFSSFFWEIGCVSSVGLFLATRWSDPGIVKRGIRGKSGVEDLLARLKRGEPQTREEEFLGDYRRLDHKLWIMKPLRAKYAKNVQAYVDDFDHFCVLLNCTIGKGNHRLFFVLAIVEVLSQIVYSYMTYQWGLEHVSNATDLAFMDFLEAFGSESWYARQSFSLASTATPGIICIVVQHAYLVGTNMTVNETVNSWRYVHFWRRTPSQATGRSFSNPFDKGGFYKNCQDFCALGIAPPSDLSRSSQMRRVLTGSSGASV